MNVRRRHDELGGLDGATLGHVARRRRSEAHLLLGPEQDDVGKCGLHGVAHAAATVGCARRIARRFGILVIVAAQVAKVRRVDPEIAGERSAERAIGGDEACAGAR
jgi:hypothetical protein